MSSLLIPILVFNFFSLIASSKDSNGSEKVNSHILVSKNGIENPTVTLSNEERGRLDIKTLKVLIEPNRTIELPLSSLIYDTQGTAWIYIENPNLKFKRSEIQIISTNNEKMKVSMNFGSNGEVVVVGAAELYGVETGVGH